MSQTLKHSGIVERIEGDRVFVVVEQTTACAGCHAKAICGSNGDKRRTIEVLTPYAASFSIGERVMVALLKNSMGISSIVWGYLAPLVVLLTTLFGAYFCNMAEGAAAAASLMAVAVYYAVLYLLRRRFEKSIQFTIVKEQ